MISSSVASKNLKSFCFLVSIKNNNLNLLAQFATSSFDDSDNFLKTPSSSINTYKDSVSTKSVEIVLNVIPDANVTEGKDSPCAAGFKSNETISSTEYSSKLLLYELNDLLLDLITVASDVTTFPLHVTCTLTCSSEL